MDTILSVLGYLLQLYSLVLLGRVLISWVDPTMGNPISQFLYQATEPVLAPIRRILPPTGPMDLSPLILFILLEVLSRILFAVR